MSLGSFDIMIKIYLYTDLVPENLKLNMIKKYLIEKGFAVETRGDFFTYFDVKKRDIAKNLAQIRIKDIEKEEVLNPKPIPEDVDTELRIIKDKNPLMLERDLTNVYSGWKFVTLIRGFLKKDFHILFTSRMLATWDDKYHGRTIMIHHPLAVISTTGIVEAPKKPTEYYTRLLSYQFAQAMGHQVTDIVKYEKEIKESLKDSFIDYDDQRLTEVAKGFVMQAVVYFLTTDAFCEDPSCRLFAAHTQEDLIKSQLEGEEFCSVHRKMVGDFKKR